MRKCRRERHVRKCHRTVNVIVCTFFEITSQLKIGCNFLWKRFKSKIYSFFSLFVLKKLRYYLRKYLVGNISPSAETFSNFALKIIPLSIKAYDNV